MRSQRAAEADSLPKSSPRRSHCTAFMDALVGRWRAADNSERAICRLGCAPITSLRQREPKNAAALSRAPFAAPGRARPRTGGEWVVDGGVTAGPASPARILTGYYFRGQAVETTTMTSKGQVTIPKAVRERLGLRRGTKIAVVVEGDHAVLRPAVSRRAAPRSGFGMVQVKGAAVAPDFDVASLLAPKAAAKRGAAR